MGGIELARQAGNKQANIEISNKLLTADKYIVRSKALISKSCSLNKSPLKYAAIIPIDKPTIVNFKP